MPFVELFAPKGALDGKDDVSKRLVTEVMKAEGAPDNEAARSISWLVVNEPDAWFAGGEALPDGDPPRYVVRVSVLAGAMDDAKRTDIVERVTRVLAEADDDPERLYRESVAWVQIIEVREGNWGSAGRVVRFEDFAKFVGFDPAAAPA
jgi:phenylpyruvate tautomerase PptA (4-oxalocrotonate tautomerase family)